MHDADSARRSTSHRREGERKRGGGIQAPGEDRDREEGKTPRKHGPRGKALGKILETQALESGLVKF